jgi:hypothetical protein
MTKLPLQPYFLTVFGYYKNIVQTGSNHNYAGMLDWLHQDYGARLVSPNNDGNYVITFESDQDALLFALKFSHK